ASSTAPAASTGAAAARCPSDRGRVYGPRISTLYDRLGVTATATPEEIRSAYRRLARLIHPDRGSAGSEQALAAVNEAWRVLSDPGRRAAYDASLRTRASTAVSPPAGSPQTAPAGPADEGAIADDEGRSFWAVALPWLLVLAVLGGIFLFTAYA